MEINLLTNPLSSPFERLSNLSENLAELHRRIFRFGDLTGGEIRAVETLRDEWTQARLFQRTADSNTKVLIPGLLCAMDAVMLAGMLSVEQQVPSRRDIHGKVLHHNELLSDDGIVDSSPNGKIFYPPGFSWHQYGVVCRFGVDSKIQDVDNSILRECRLVRGDSARYSHCLFLEEVKLYKIRIVGMGSLFDKKYSANSSRIIPASGEVNRDFIDWFKGVFTEWFSSLGDDFNWPDWPDDLDDC